VSPVANNNIVRRADFDTAHPARESKASIHGLPRLSENAKPSTEEHPRRTVDRNVDVVLHLTSFVMITPRVTAPVSTCDAVGVGWQLFNGPLNKDGRRCTSRFVQMVLWFCVSPVLFRDWLKGC
jgi:hypothetical protein